MDSLNELKRIYYDISHPASYGSIAKLTKEMHGKLTREQIKTWLRAQETYTLHKPMRKRFPRNRYVVSNMNHLWQVDLSDLRSLSQYNDDYKYILCVIDIFSKIAFVRALKNKNVNSIINAFQNIFLEYGNKPKHIQSDKGSEFIAKRVQHFFRDNNINFYTTNNPDIKASIVERFQRTMKSKMWRYFTHNNTYRYIDILNDLIYSYNHSRHSSIKMCPSEVNSNNIMTVWRNLYDKKPKMISMKQIINVGDYVRISKTKHTFEKGYETNWSDEIFIISSIVKRVPFTLYRLTDLNHESIAGTFYEKELQLVNINTNTIHKIDKMISTRGTGLRKEVLVKWRGYSDKFNSWIPYSDLQEI